MKLINSFGKHNTALPIGVMWLEPDNSGISISHVLWEKRNPINFPHVYKFYIDQPFIVIGKTYYWEIWSKQTSLVKSIMA